MIILRKRKEKEKGKRKKEKRKKKKEKRKKKKEKEKQKQKNKNKKTKTKSQKERDNIPKRVVSKHKEIFYQEFEHSLPLSNNKKPLSNIHLVETNNQLSKGYVLKKFLGVVA